MTLKLSVTWSRKVFQSFGTVSRKNARIALAKCVWGKVCLGRVMTIVRHELVHNSP